MDSWQRFFNLKNPFSFQESSSSELIHLSRSVWQSWGTVSTAGTLLFSGEAKAWGKLEQKSRQLQPGREE